MKINELDIKNFRGIAEAQIDFDGKSTIIYGINGMGKSTILDACSILFSKILREAAGGDNQIELRMIKEKDVKLGESMADIAVDVIVEDDHFMYYRRRRDGNNAHNGQLLKNISDSVRKHYVGQYNAEDEDDENGEAESAKKKLIVDNRDMPIYVFYGINRYIERRSVIKRRYTGGTGKLDAWRDRAFDGIINFELFFDWFRGRQEYENSIRVEKADFEDVQLKFARQAILMTLGEEFSAIKIRIQDDSPELVVTKKGQEFNVQQLSEGEKSMLALVGDLARRLSIANPQSTQPLEGKGIVLIDEIDLHLHPSWQARVMPTLLQIFPNIQFIVTTHAPKVLGEIGDEVNIIRLQENAGNIEVCPIEPLNGWDVNTILEEYMDTNSLNEQTEELIRRMNQCIYEKKYNEAEELVNKLAAMTDEKNTAVVRGRILIAKGR